MYIHIFIILAIALVLGFVTTTGVKSQWIRIIDVIIIGPLMIYIGISNLAASQQSTSASLLSASLLSASLLNYLLIFFGATTITYNLRNYFYSSGWL